MAGVTVKNRVNIKTKQLRERPFNLKGGVMVFF